MPCLRNCWRGHSPCRQPLVDTLELQQHGVFFIRCEFWRKWWSDFANRIDDDDSVFRFVANGQHSGGRIPSGFLGKNISSVLGQYIKQVPGRAIVPVASTPRGLPGEPTCHSHRTRRPRTPRVERYRNRPPAEPIRPPGGLVLLQESPSLTQKFSDCPPDQCSALGGSGRATPKDEVRG